MSVRLRNLRTSAPLHVPLTSGESLRVSPRESSPDVDESEVLNNPKVTRLVEQGELEIVRPSGGTRRTAGRGGERKTK
ncbi:MAG: hypothetical protein ACM4D3_22145 [Candidatus Sericytochromatia bacterium]